MVKARQRQLGRAAASARGRFSFVDLDRKTGASQGQRGGQPVRARADDDSIERGHHWHGSGPSARRALVLAGARGCPSTPGEKRACLMAQFTGAVGKWGAMVPRGCRRVTGEAIRLARYRFSATFRRCWPGYLSLALLIGLVGGLAIGSIAGARRTDSSFTVFWKSTNPSDLSGMTGILNPSASLFALRRTARFQDLAPPPREKSGDAVRHQYPAPAA